VHVHTLVQVVFIFFLRVSPIVSTNRWVMWKLNKFKTKRLDNSSHIRESFQETCELSSYALASSVNLLVLSPFDWIADAPS
jgi:hypothetical protein